MIRLRPAIIALVSAAHSLASAQAVDPIGAARRHIEELKVDSAIARLQSALAQRAALNREQLIRVNVLLGVAEVMLSRNELAQVAFHEALWLDSELRVDSLAHLSSGLSEVFEREKASWSSLLRVTTNPTGGLIRVGARVLGRAPLERRVPAEAVLALSAARGCAQLDTSCSGGQVTMNLAIPAQKLLSVHFDMPEDTLSWPATPARNSLLASYEIESRTKWVPSSPPPAAIELPQKGVGYTRFFMIVGGVTGFGAGFACSNNGCSNGQSQAAAIGGFLVGIFSGGVLGSWIDDAPYRAAQQRYTTYVEARTAWDARMKAENASWIEQRVAQRLVELGQRREEIIATNDAIRARNALIRPPHVSVEPLPVR